ncbi:hypothetical protein [Methylomonas albis]|nr:hypothetical protein [Methylomonas albis]
MPALVVGNVVKHDGGLYFSAGRGIKSARNLFYLRKIN